MDVELQKASEAAFEPTTIKCDIVLSRMDVELQKSSEVAFEPTAIKCDVGLSKTDNELQKASEAVLGPSAIKCDVDSIFICSGNLISYLGKLGLLFTTSNTNSSRLLNPVVRPQLYERRISEMALGRFPNINILCTFEAGQVHHDVNAREHNR
jgi:hypothetical protein